MGYSLVVMHVFLIAGVSLLTEHRLNSCDPRAQLLHGTQDPPGSGMEQVDSLPLSHQGSPRKLFFLHCTLDLI